MQSQISEQVNHLILSEDKRIPAKRKAKFKSDTESKVIRRNSLNHSFTKSSNFLLACVLLKLLFLDENLYSNTESRVDFVLFFLLYEKSGCANEFEQNMQHANLWPEHEIKSKENTGTLLVFRSWHDR